ncbi:hypothetical protein [Mesorhizobium sp. CAU 1732]|uniref:hypothetical protein n=1 Tax=Mesorhizobium sp. CAU 1732 TaxID=3140358 RepID=UPI0032619E67
MLIGGSPQAGVGSRRQVASVEDIGSAHAAPQARHFKAISSISPSSLASAYKAMRAQEASMASTPPIAANDRLANAAILSAVGLGAAFAAYRDAGGSADT